MSSQTPVPTSNNLLTDEECEKIRQLSEVPEFNLQGCTHSFRYFGLTQAERELYKVDVEYLETTLKKWIPSLISFSNFCDDKKGKLIRCQTAWSDSFTGVSYFTLPTNKEEIANDN